MASGISKIERRKRNKGIKIYLSQKHKPKVLENFKKKKNEQSKTKE